MYMRVHVDRGLQRAGWAAGRAGGRAGGPGWRAGLAGQALGFFK